MGSGDFGSNGSVHWRIIHTIDEARKVGGFIRGKDPNVPCEKNPDKSLVPDHFEVTLRFNTKQELEAALQTVRRENRDRTLVIRVPARDPNPLVPPPERDWEVRVSWKPSAKSSGGGKAPQKRQP
jgi:hypothetical protein